MIEVIEIITGCYGDSVIYLSKPTGSLCLIGGGDVSSEDIGSQGM